VAEPLRRVFADRADAADGLADRLSRRMNEQGGPAAVTDPMDCLIGSALITERA
jgi:hypothetical protein